MAASDFVNSDAANLLPAEQSNTFYSKPIIACGDGFYPTVIGTLSKVDTLPSSECEGLAERGASYGFTFKHRLAYDTLRYYIERCYYLQEAPYYFNTISSECFSVSYDEGNWEVPNYKQWLLSVLYLNPDTLYYCRDAFELARVQVWLDSGRRDFREGISVLQYLLDSIDCQYLDHDIQGFIKQLTEAQWYQWRDTVTDSTTATPPDTTTIFTLDELGLQSLRRIQSGVSEADIIAAGLITEIASVPNPSRGDVELFFRLTDPAVLRLELFDALGRSMMSHPLGWQSKGEHSSGISMGSWASGTYYARLSTLRGEVKTVKIIKE